jgi:simple sugar transport system ATP-binding protein
MSGNSDSAMISRLELRGITKRFPGVIANSAVDLAVQPGEIHALLGENGAGKSTLVKIIYGVLQADEGEILWKGKPVRINNPHMARSLGIGMVFQHFSLFEAMSVLENVALGLDNMGSMRELADKIRTISASYGLPLDPDREVSSLSVGERQRIEIVRCLLQSPQLLIMDEPTSVLTPQEVDKLFQTLRKLAAEGCSILYISHKLQEIKALCDRATILRGGKFITACDPKTTTTGQMAALMVGAEVRSVTRKGGAENAAGAARLVVDGLDLPSTEAHGVSLRDINLEVRAGEVVGIAGVAGNGQNELLLALDGEIPVERDHAIMIDGAPAGRLNAAQRRARGLCCVPEERNGHAAVPEFSLVDNTILSALHRKNLLASGLLRIAQATDFAKDIVKQFDVRTAGVGAAAASLSGGNLQKFIVGREILQKPGVLIVSQPTWGVDAGAAATIHQALLALAAEGSAVLVISQDLDELLAITDRLAVINLGTLSNAIPTAGVSVEEIGLLMGGVHGLDTKINAPAEQPSAWPRPAQEQSHVH